MAESAEVGEVRRRSAERTRAAVEAQERWEAMTDTERHAITCYAPQFGRRCKHADAVLGGPNDDGSEWVEASTRRLVADEPWHSLDTYQCSGCGQSWPGKCANTDGHCPVCRTGMGG